MKLRLLLFFLFVTFNIFSQGIDNLWLMGYQSWGGRPYGGSNLNFTGGVRDTSYQSRIMNFSATNGVICDKNGNLLFSSNGIYIANAFNETMLNGGGLNPSYYTSISHSPGLLIPQANLIIPFPGDSNKYYLFHETDDDWFNTDYSFYLYYSVIDMLQDAGRGAVVQKNIVLRTDSLIPGYITACKHANGRDWWLVNHQINTNKYFKYLISPDGIHGPYTQSIGSDRGDYFGQITFSHDGSKVAYYEPNHDLDLMDFDRCTGIFSNLIHVDIDDSAVLGGAFSPDSKILYISSNTYIYQFDLTASDVAASKTTVAVYDDYSENSLFATDFGPEQLAPDGKIYIVPGNGTHYIHVINNPDILGLGCDVCQHCVQLPSFNFLTIPNHPNYFLGPEIGSICDSLPLALSPSPSEMTGMRLFPNPVVNEDVTFTYNVSPEAGVISIFNIEGKEITRYHLPQWSSVQHLKLPKLSGGVYLARITQGTATAGVKFIKE